MLLASQEGRRQLHPRPGCCRFLDRTDLDAGRYPGPGCRLPPGALRRNGRASVDSPHRVGQPSKRIPSDEKDDRGQMSGRPHASDPS